MGTHIVTSRDEAGERIETAPRNRRRPDLLPTAVATAVLLTAFCLLEFLMGYAYVHLWTDSPRTPPTSPPRLVQPDDDVHPRHPSMPFVPPARSVAPFRVASFAGARAIPSVFGERIACLCSGAERTPF